MAGGGVKINNITVSGGADGKTPIFKIKGGELFNSYDNGTTWYNLGEVKGETGPQGPQGVQGLQGPQGEQGEQGNSPYIGANGNWWIGDIDTGVAVSGGGSSPQEIEQLKQDVKNLERTIEDGDFKVRNAGWADYAEKDKNGNVIHDTYATKERVETFIEDIQDDAGIQVYSAKFADEASKAHNDGDGFNISQYYAKKSEVEDLHDSLEDGSFIPMYALNSASTTKDSMGRVIQETYAEKTELSAHNTGTTSHNDIRLLIDGLTTRLNALADSDDTTLDQMSEIVAYIKDNKYLIDSITASKVNVADIVNNLTTNVTNKPLSASQGVVLKALIDSLSQNKLNASELQTAINTALAQAKASGEFKGDKGDTGETGSAGKDGADGAKGADGVGVKSVAQTTTSSADGGSNVITVTLTDGKTSTFTVKNGSKGSTGADGYTPVKGVDYFTEEDKQEIAETVKAQNGIPDYWITHLDERIEDIRRAMESAGRNKSSFFFYSDSHWSNEDTYTAKLAPSLLKYLYKKTPINKTNYGGDIVSAESTDTDIMAYLWDWREQLRGLPNHHSVIGNHDDGNSTDRLLSKEYIYSYLLAPEENNDIVWGGDFYYYIDDKSENTRYLYLDVFYDKASSEQLAFVSEALKTTPADWHIVAICHAWFGVNYGTVENPIYPPVLNGFDTKAKILLDMFDNYNARSGEYSDCGGWVELCIGGHYHLDHYEHTSGGIPVIIVEADTFHDREHPMPTHGNIGESAVSAVVVDYNNKLVKVIRVGRGNSFEVPIEVGEVTYTNVISTSIGSDGKPFNGGQGWASNSRIGSGVINNYIGNGNYYITGLIEINPAINNTIRLRNITFKQTDMSNNLGMAFYDSSYKRINARSGGSGTTWTTPAMISNTGGYSPVLDANKNILEFTLKASQHTTNTEVKYIAICAELIDSTSIITINEPIE